MECPVCGTSNEDGKKFCHSCGSALEMPSWQQATTAVDANQQAATGTEANPQASTAMANGPQAETFFAPEPDLRPDMQPYPASDQPRLDPMMPAPQDPQPTGASPAASAPAPNPQTPFLAQDAIDATAQDQPPKVNMVSAYLLLGVAAVVLVATFFLAGANSLKTNSELHEATDTASTDFKIDVDYNLGNIYVYDGWEITRSSRYSSDKDPTAYDVYVLFEAHDNYCVGMLNVSESDKEPFGKIQDYLHNDSSSALDLQITAVGTVRDLESGRKSELDEHVDNIEDMLGITCTPVYYDFEYISSSDKDYESGKAHYVSRTNTEILFGGISLSGFFLIAGMRRLFSLQKEQRRINEAFEATKLQRMPQAVPMPQGAQAPQAGPMPQASQMASQESQMPQETQPPQAAQTPPNGPGMV